MIQDHGRRQAGVTFLHRHSRRHRRSAIHDSHKRFGAPAYRLTDEHAIGREKNVHLRRRWTPIPAAVRHRRKEGVLCLMTLMSSPWKLRERFTKAFAQSAMGETGPNELHRWDEIESVIMRTGV